MPTLPPELDALGLTPHPEGGFYRETHRSPHCTVIDFVLLPGQTSAWHRVRHAEEVWLHHRGGPLALHRWHEGEHERIVLDADRSTAVIPIDHWQAAEPLGDTWVWVSCVVAPPFAFEHFELAPADLPVPTALAHLLPGGPRG